MDLGLLYGDFVMDNRELTLHTTIDGSGVFRDDAGLTHCTIRPFRNDDPDIERDPLATNRLFDSGGIELFGCMVVAGPTTDVIYVLVPDSTTCTADEICPTDLQHVIGLRLGPADNLSAILPQEDLRPMMISRIIETVYCGTRQKLELFDCLPGPLLVFITRQSPAREI